MALGNAIQAPHAPQWELHPTQCRERRKLFPASEKWPVMGGAPSDQRYLSRTVSRPEGDDRALHAWCYKRHARAPRLSPESKQWGRRYVKVDDLRGTIGYAHDMDSQPRNVLALQDVTSVKPLQPGCTGRRRFGRTASEEHPGFEVCAPPLTLRLRVVGPDEEQRRWVASLERRVEHWRCKAAAEGPSRVVPNLDADADTEREGHWLAVAGRGRGQDTSARAAW